MLYNEEKEEHEVELSECERVERLSLEERAPILVTVAKVGTANIVDPTDEEGLVSSASLLVGVVGSEGSVALLQKEGLASLEPESVSEMLALGLKAAGVLNAALLAKLKEEESLGPDRAIAGFLVD